MARGAVLLWLLNRARRSPWDTLPSPALLEARRTEAITPGGASGMSTTNWPPGTHSRRASVLSAVPSEAPPDALEGFSRAPELVTSEDFRIFSRGSFFDPAEETTSCPCPVVPSEFLHSWHRQTELQRIPAYFTEAVNSQSSQSFDTSARTN